MKKSTVSAVVAATLGTVMAGSANAFVISSGNATVAGDILGLSEWSVNGTNQLASQTWWFNTDAGDGTPYNYELADYDGAAAESSTATSASVLYNMLAELGLTVQVDYSLSGGTNTSTLNESVTIINNSGAAANFSLFQFTDFDLGGYAPYDSADDDVGDGTDGFNYGQNDTVTQVSGNYVTQSNGTMSVVEAATVPWPSLTSIGQAVALEDALFDDMLSGTNAGDTFTGDAAWIWQYTFNIADGESASIGKTMIMETVVPVPAAVWLFGSGLLGLVGVARRRTRA